MPTRSRWPSRTIPSRFVGFFMLDPTRKDAIDYAKRALDEGLRTICLFPAMHRYSLHDDRVATCSSLPRRAAAARSSGSRCSRTAACCRSASARSSACRARSTFASAIRSTCTALALKYPAVPIIIPHFGARHAARSVDARGLLSQRASRHVELERVDQIHAGPDARAGVQDARSTSSGPIACCSAPTRRSSRADGTARSTRNKNPRSTPLA